MFPEKQSKAICKKDTRTVDPSFLQYHYIKIQAS